MFRLGVEMSVRIDRARHHEHTARFDHSGTVTRCKVRTDFCDPFAANPDVRLLPAFLDGEAYPDIFIDYRQPLSLIAFPLGPQKAVGGAQRGDFEGELRCQSCRTYGEATGILIRGTIRDHKTK